MDKESYNNSEDFNNDMKFAKDEIHDEIYTKSDVDNGEGEYCNELINDVAANEVIKLTTTAAYNLHKWADLWEFCYCRSHDEEGVGKGLKISLERAFFVSKYNSVINFRSKIAQECFLS